MGYRLIIIYIHNWSNMTLKKLPTIGTRLTHSWVKWVTKLIFGVGPNFASILSVNLIFVYTVCMCICVLLLLFIGKLQVNAECYPLLVHWLYVHLCLFHSKCNPIFNKLQCAAWPNLMCGDLFAQHHWCMGVQHLPISIVMLSSLPELKTPPSQPIAIVPTTSLNYFF